MEIPDLSDDSMDDPLYNPDKDVSEDEDIEAATEAALNAEAGELKEDEPKDPLKDDNRIDFANVGLSPEDYIKSRIPQETKKSTKQAVKLYDTVMGKKLLWMVLSSNPFWKHQLTNSQICCHLMFRHHPLNK